MIDESHFSVLHLTFRDGGMPKEVKVQRADCKIRRLNISIDIQESGPERSYLEVICKRPINNLKYDLNFSATSISFCHHPE